MKITKYNIPKDNNSWGKVPGTSTQLYGSNANSQVTSAESAKKLDEIHSIFGQPFDGTQDVAGDITNAQNITNEGDINVKSYTDDSGEHGGNIIADNDITAKDFIGEKVQLTDQIVAPTGYIDSISGSNLEYNYADIKELLSQDITTKNLTVTGAAHFFELIIDKIKAAGGAVILSPAEGFKIDIVQKNISSQYRLLWKANNGDKAISNMWKVGDQAICRSFNQAQLGTSYNVSNKYYWCVVQGVGTVKIADQDYHYIIISNIASLSDGTVNPEVGDEIAMLGSRALKEDGTIDIERQSAIYISAYSSMDQGLTAPFIAQYTGINNFNLAAHRYTWFAHNGNEIRGNFKVTNGKTVEDYVSEKISANLSSYHLVPINEIAEIRNDDLYVNFEYAIYDGPNELSKNAWYDNFYLRLVWMPQEHSEPFEIDDEHPYYYDEKFLQQWGHNDGQEPDRFYVDLYDQDDNLLERRVIPVIYTAIAQLEITDSINAKVQGNTGRISQLELTADGLSSTVQAMKGFEYDLYNTENWTFDYLLTSKNTNTDFINCFTVPATGGGIQLQLNKSMSFIHPIPVTETSTICINSCWSATLMFFNSNKKYLGNYKTYGVGESNIQLPANAQYVGLTLNLTTSGTAPIAGITSIPKGIISSGIKISDSKIASSLIQQTADEILMKVDEVSLKIDNKKITLDGDTEINGNLNINNSETGFTLQGSDGNTQISPKSIGTFSEFSVTSNITDNISKHITTGMPNPDAMTVNPDGSSSEGTTRYYSLMYEMQVSLGTLKSGDYIEFKNQTLSFTAGDGNAMSSGIKKYEVYKGDALVTSFFTYSHNYDIIGSFTVNSNGDYTLKITINFNCTRNKPIEDNDNTKPSMDMYKFSMPFTADYSLQIVRPTGEAHMLIGYDGIAANFGNNKTVYIGKEETTIKYGNYGLSITSSGIKKYNGSNWVTANI